MKIEYELIKILSPEIVVLDSFEYGTQIWVVSNLTKKHKDDNCGICTSKVGNKAYRPTTNKSNRMIRICISCIGDLKKEKGGGK